MPSLKRSACKGVKVLITSGPTSVPIDDMRVITNRSTGEMGRLLASAFISAGAKVTLLEGAVTTPLPLPDGVNLQKFYFFHDLAALLNKELPHAYDIIIHAAAVSDFELKKPFRGKISSGLPISLQLSPTPKIISNIKGASPDSLLVGFKFESDIESRKSRAKALKLFKEDSCDLVVLNKMDTKGYAAVILDLEGGVSKTVKSKGALVSLLLTKVNV